MRVVADIAREEKFWTTVKAEVPLKQKYQSSEFDVLFLENLLATVRDPRSGVTWSSFVFVFLVPK